MRAEQPRYEFYHGSTPTFLVEDLLEQYGPRASMALIGSVKLFSVVVQIV
jgi:hypothetical protein